MTVLNFRITKIAGQRTTKRLDKVNIQANSTIKTLERGKDKNIGDYIHVNFLYEVEYSPDFGGITLEGSLWYTHPKLASIAKDKKEKVKLKDGSTKEVDVIELNNEAATDISTAILQDSLIEAITLSQKINLPPPLQLPKVTVKPKHMRFRKAS